MDEEYGILTNVSMLKKEQVSKSAEEQESTRGFDLLTLLGLGFVTNKRHWVWFNGIAIRVATQTIGELFFNYDRNSNYLQHPIALAF